MTNRTIADRLCIALPVRIANFPTGRPLPTATTESQLMPDPLESIPQPPIIYPESPREVGFIEVIESVVGGLIALLLEFEIIVGGILVVIDPPSGNIHVPRV